MSASEYATLDPEERAAIAAALATDPALAEELEMIIGHLGERERVAFWSALAELCPGVQRPAAAVLAALERAAAGPREAH